MDGVSSPKRSPSGAARMALPFPAYGAGVPERLQWAPAEQPHRRRAGTRPGADVPSLPEERGQAPREGFGTPTAGIGVTHQELSRELGVVAVLAEGIVRVGELPGAAGKQVPLHVFAGDCGRPRLDHEPQRVSQRLSEEASDQGCFGIGHRLRQR